MVRLFAAGQIQMGTERMSELSPGEAGGIFAGIVALLASLGTAARFLLGRSDKAHVAEDRRQHEERERLVAWRTSLDARERNERVTREKRLSNLERIVDVLERVAFDQREVLIKVTAELEQHNPLSGALLAAKAQLAKHYPGFYEPVEPGLPDDQADIIDRWRSTP